ncbi:MAG TPA: NAD(P)H-dependent oxidoreductase [Vicinamibacteria bacterium]|nr:NAD(P)H-dependent oxidoreductase [Vicinamibacteria bacterium]
MGPQRDVAVIVGSLRKGSFSRLTARALAASAPESLKLEIVEIRDLSLYDQDLDGSPPAPWLAFKERIKRADGVLFVTPEYNRSVPGVLKNALDIASRPYGQSAWNGKPAGIVSVTPGPLGAFGANHHLRQSLVFLNMPALQQPEAYISDAATLFDAGGALIHDRTRELLGKYMQAFATWVETHFGRA